MEVHHPHRTTGGGVDRQRVEVLPGGAVGDEIVDPVDHVLHRGQQAALGPDPLDERRDRPGGGAAAA
ncbi:MAG: hypothetical protein EBZ59_05495, partial [Planctomycetia bacterium]|nr:hypothetical protein [Planctomycetia bacterium]